MKQRIDLVRIDSESDFEYFAQLAFNEEAMQMNMGRVFTQEEATEYFSYVLEFNTANKDAGTFKVFLKKDKVFIGDCSLWIREDCAEVEYMLLPQFWGQGYATEMVACLVELARQIPSIKKLSGLIDRSNEASKKVLTKNGFEFEKLFDVEDNDSTVEVYSLTIK